MKDLKTEIFKIHGGKRLTGTVRANGSKNAVLPIIVASILGRGGKIYLNRVPNIEDVKTLVEILRLFGAKIHHEIDKKRLIIDTSQMRNDVSIPYELFKRMRASFLIIGAFLPRFGHARIPLPGGCSIGTRSIDFHIKGFRSLGIQVDVEKGYAVADVTNGIKGSQIYLDFPSVGATENILLTACLAEGKTIIENAAQEPEVLDMANFLNSMGADISGAGTPTIKINGVKELKATEYTVMPDRIEVGTYLIAAVITQGDIRIVDAISDHLNPLISKLREVGAMIETTDNEIHVVCSSRPNATNIKTLPYPGFPTDLQAQFMALLTIAKGTSTVTETIFENRFMHVDELRRMKSNILVEGRVAVIEGQEKLSGCQVTATDLRAGAALVLAALNAEGETQVEQIQHIDRGYDNFIQELVKLGADIQRVKC